LDANTVFGLRVPASTPVPVITRLNAEINKILAMQAVKDRIAGQR
jgi:tripartite-type tricarboxylate transporter receptor subunit TctC